MRPFTQPFEALHEWAPLPIRLVVGYGFMAHGFAKLTRGMRTASYSRRKHPVRLSITHNFCTDHGPQRDIGQAR